MLPIIDRLLLALAAAVIVGISTHGLTIWRIAQ